MTTFVDESKACKIIVAGTRTFNNAELLAKKLHKLTRKIKRPVVIVTGAAKGADALAEKWALSYPRMMTVKRFHADWEIHGKAAGPIRNQKMVDYADRLIAFWDGESPGTADVIRRARKAGLKVKVFRYE